MSDDLQLPPSADGTDTNSAPPPAEPPGGVRRVGARDRKPRLNARPLQFPPDRADSMGDNIVDTVADAAPPPPADDVERFPPLAPPSAAPRTPAAPARATASAPARRPANKAARGYNIVTALFVMATVLLCGYWSALWFLYNTPLNPLPPFTVVVFVTATKGTPPVGTPDGAQIISVDMATADPNAALLAPTSADAAALPFPFVADAPLYTPYVNGCNWSSIAGTVTALDGAALNGYRITISDTTGQLIAAVFSGAVLTYGDGGFEFALAEAPQAAEYRVRLFTAAGVPLSDEISVQTQADCAGNVTLVNFRQAREL
jgi:hypothetical protein